MRKNEYFRRTKGERDMGYVDPISGRIKRRDAIWSVNREGRMVNTSEIESTQKNHKLIQVEWVGNVLKNYQLNDELHNVELIHLKELVVVSNSTSPMISIDLINADSTHLIELNNGINTLTLATETLVAGPPNVYVVKEFNPRILRHYPYMDGIIQSLSMRLYHVDPSTGALDPTITPIRCYMTIEVINRCYN